MIPEMARRKAESAKRRVGERALGVAARARRARETALLLRALIRPITPRRGSNAIRILVLPANGFLEDMLEVAASDPRIELHALSRTAVKAVASAFLSPRVNDFTYGSPDAADRQGMRAYREFLVEVLLRMPSELRFHAVASGNFAYYAEQELAAAFEACGVPFVVLLKECLNTPGLERFWERVYREWRRPFGGRKILVYNEGTRGLLLRSGVAPSERISVVGMPRLDRQHRDRSGGMSAAQLLFLVFGPRTGLPDIPSSRRDLPSELRYTGWRDLARECHRAVLDVAVEAPESRIIVKAKEVLAHQREVEEHYQGRRELPPNVEVISVGEVFEPLRRSRIVVGFKSTALLEAMAAGKAVMVPRFAEASDPALADFLLDLGEYVEYPESASAFRASMLQHLRGQRTAPGAAEWAALARPVLERWLGNADGRSAERARAELLELSRVA